MLWNSWINSNILHLGVKCSRVLEPKSSPPMTQKYGCDVGCGWRIQISTLQNHILYLWWENGRVSVLWITQISPNSLNLSVKSGQGLSHFWFLTPPVTETHVVETIVEDIYQSQPSPTIHYTCNESLGGLRCCEILESIQTYSILVWNVVGYLSRNHDHPWLKNMGVAFVVDEEFKSQPCKTIYYTYGERMEGLVCCE